MKFPLVLALVVLVLLAAACGSNTTTVVERTIVETQTEETTTSPTGPVVIPCAPGYTGRYAFLTKPGDCRGFQQNEVDHAGEIHLINLDWRSWGRDPARGQGTAFGCYTGECVNRTARVTASDLGEHCGRRVYARLDVHMPAEQGLPIFDAVLNPPTCGGRVEKR